MDCLPCIVVTVDNYEEVLTHDAESSVADNIEAEEENKEDREDEEQEEEEEEREEEEQDKIQKEEEIYEEEEEEDEEGGSSVADEDDERAVPKREFLRSFIDRYYAPLLMKPFVKVCIVRGPSLTFSIV